jgi:predicted SprT family Zn-dependent metalloprotease
MNATNSSFNRKTDRENLLKQTLESLLKAPVRLTVTDNRRAMVSGFRKDKAYHLRLHHMFLDADGEVIASLAGYLSGNGRSSRERLKRFFGENRGKIKRDSERPKQRGPYRGNSLHLEACYRRINDKYFGGQVDCPVCWSHRRTRRGQKSVRLGSYSPRTGVIRINPILDNPIVPLYVVEDVIYHEMLHHHLGIETCGGKRVSHHANFREMEKRFSEKEKARLWIKRNLSRLVRNKRGSGLTSY